MSRIGKQPVVVPSGVKVKQTADGDGVLVSVEGPKGKLSFPFRKGVEFAVDGDAVRISRSGDATFERAYHGTARALIANMVQGVSQGFEKTLDIEGVGYNAKLEKKNVVLQIGFCHPVIMAVPDGLTVETPKPTQIIVRGPDKQAVGEFAAQVRKIRPPEPYKGKGIRYSGEKIIRKAGKAFGSGE
jgi:large subunit ribosomal protein L6